MSTVRPSRRIERAGVNALRALLEDHEHIVQEIDGGNDHGEDFHVMLTRSGRRTGHVFAIQVKSGKKYKRAHGYAIPVEDHHNDWTESRIPALGVVYDPETSELYWVNLSKELKGTQSRSTWVQIPRSSILSAETIRGFAADIETYIDGTGMRVRGATKEEVFAKAAKARDGIDPETAPNPLYEGLADLALRHEEKLDRTARIIRRSIPLTILVIIMAFEWPYQVKFVETYSDQGPVMWVLNLYIFIFFMALTIFFEFRAGRIPQNTGRFFALIVGNFLWLPVVDHDGHRGWWGTTWITLGAITPNIGYVFLFANFIGFAARRKKMRQAADAQDR
ncbi:DUF4365 domain-containing protein [Streptomyces kronopolitis]|uniref:DUF4365 domain-containing protein n=1 Tax=Streptomyces kronopolitis TaxID=1612435 RepID=UPI0020C0ACD7|nr:DUF4365 domain-containing protein [Streptomyces kronopolitis]MCL6298708.1 DUF4365 domain-containing protein [Streptomyces kronopolitis]